MPENIEGVEIITVSKRQPRAARLMAYTRALWRAASQADVIYAENGASVELPLVVVSFLSRTPILMHLGDQRAHTKAAGSIALRNIEKAALSNAKKVVADSPLERPEILPFAEYPINEFAAYEASWLRHLEMLEDLFIYAKQ